MSDETQYDRDAVDDNASGEQGDYRRPWFLNGDEDVPEKHSYAPRDSHDWRTAAEFADPTDSEDSSEPIDLSDDVEQYDESDEPEQASTDTLPAEVSHDKAPASGLAFPEGLIDLTEETEDSVRIPASAYRGETTQEPVHGTVEVDRAVNQPNETVIMPVETAADDRRAARARALGEVDPGADVVAAPTQFTPPEMYKAWPSFTLFIFRLIIATILSIRATQELLNFSATKALWASSVLPNPEVLAIVQIIVEYLIALMLLLGLASRVAGLLMIVLNILVLSFLVWGSSNPFKSGVIGFTGEYEVLMLVIGLVFAGIGGGGAAVDGAVHRARLERKNAKLGGVRPEED